MCHQCTHGGRGGIENVDLVLVDDLADTPVGRIAGHTLEHQRGRAIGQRAVDDVAVARHPADIRRAPVDIAIVIIEHVAMGHRGIEQITARGVLQALGRAGGTGGVEDEQRVFGAHRLGRAVTGLTVHQLMEPGIAAAPVHLTAGTPHHQHVVDTVGAITLQRLIDVLLERHALATPQ